MTDPMPQDVIAALPVPRVPVRGGGTFPVHRIYCVGRNFADHAREMGATPPPKSERGLPTFFMKPADAIGLGGDFPYPSSTAMLHHEVELVVAIGRDAPGGGVVAEADAASLIFGYGVGLDLTRRDLQNAAKAKGLPWDTGKGFDGSAPISELVPAAQAGDLSARTLRLHVNGELRQQSTLDQMIWDVADIIHDLSTLYALRAGDLIYTGTPAGVAALLPGDAYMAEVEGLVTLRGRVLPPSSAPMR